MAIKVHLDTQATPPVTVQPTTENINSGNQTIKWQPGDNQPAFTFVGVTWWTTPNPFSQPTITTDPVEMSVTEDNDDSGANYQYTITVNYNGTDYSSLAQPVGRRVGNGGTPTIHNN